MMNRRLMLAIPSALVLTSWAAGGPARGQESEPTEAQPTLPRQHIVIVTKDGAHHPFDVEMALTPRQQEVGLMFRPSVPPDSGMLFDWGTERESQMWMKNTIAPLDMVFIRADGRIAAIAENTVPRSLAVIDSGEPVRATLELAAGTTARLGITVGDRVQGAIFGGAA